MKYRAILLFGPPGAGKGTQGKILGTIPNYFHCACGDAFRNLTIENEIGRVFIEYSSRGELVPDDATIRLWRETIDASKASGRFNPERDTLLLDGIPRNRRQAEMLDDALEVQAVLKFECTDQKKIIERLQRRALRENRLDDANLEVIKHRVITYQRETQPVLDFYGPSRIHEINSNQPPVKVLLDVIHLLCHLDNLI